MVTCNGSDCGVHVCKCKVLEVPVPLVVCIVVNKVTEVYHELIVRKSFNSTVHCFGGMRKVLVAACLNVGNGNEGEFAVAVICSECAVTAPKVERSVSYTVCIACARLKIVNGNLMTIEVTELVDVACRILCCICIAAVKIRCLNDLNIASCIGLGVPAEAS